MIFLVVIDWGSYDGGDEVLFATLDEAAADAQQQVLDREHGAVVVRRYALDQLVPRR